MLYECPYCGVSIKGRVNCRVQISRKDGSISEKLAESCPECGGLIEKNHHVTEKTLILSIRLFLGAITLTLLILPREISRPLSLALILAMVGLTIYFESYRLRFWQRFKKYESPDE